MPVVEASAGSDVDLTGVAVADDRLLAVVFGVDPDLDRALETRRLDVLGVAVTAGSEEPAGAVAVTGDADAARLL